MCNNTFIIFKILGGSGVLAWNIAKLNSQNHVILFDAPHILESICLPSLPANNLTIIKGQLHVSFVITLYIQIFTKLQ